MALSYRGPDSQPHLMVTRAAMVDPDICVAAFGKPLDAGDVHLFSAPTCGAFVQPGSNKRSNADIEPPHAQFGSDSSMS
jgi:hypothetical protein